MRKLHSSIPSFVISLLFVLIFTQIGLAQKPAKTNIFPATGSAGIGTITPKPSALLEMSSTTQGFLPPRMMKQNMLGIVGPDRGLLVFVTDGETPGYYYNNGEGVGEWLPLITPTSSYLAGTGIQINGSTISNTAPNIPVTLTGGGGTTVTGTYPNFTISSTAISSGVNSALSNLTATSINQSLIPQANLDLGSNLNRWRDAFFTGQLNSSSISANRTSGNSISGITIGSGYGIYGKGGTSGIYGEGPSGVAGEGIKGVHGHGYTNDFNASTFGLYGTASAVFGSTYGVYGSAASYGVYGISDNFGVYGSSGNYGIYGSGGSSGVHGNSVQGTGVSAFSSASHGLLATTVANLTHYAGYFNGNIFSTGSFTASDRNLKQNIKIISDAMDIINKLHPTQYQFRQDGNYKLMNMPKGNHYGLMAQEVEKVLPGLIKETKFDPNIAKQIKTGDEQNTKNTTLKKEEEISFKAMNYTELIPIMIKGMQELSKINEEKDAAIKDLQKQIDELKQLVKSNSTATNGKIQNRLAIVELKSTSIIEQNTPNPFTNNTSIRYSLTDNKGNAFINFYSSAGVVLKSVKLNASGKGVIDVKASELASGIYQYSLVIDGKVIETKQMIRLK